MPRNFFAPYKKRRKRKRYRYKPGTSSRPVTKSGGKAHSHHTNHRSKWQHHKKQNRCKHRVFPRADTHRATFRHGTYKSGRDKGLYHHTRFVGAACIRTAFMHKDAACTRARAILNNNRHACRRTTHFFHTTLMHHAISRIVHIYFYNWFDFGQYLLLDSGQFEYLRGRGHNMVGICLFQLVDLSEAPAHAHTFYARPTCCFHVDTRVADI